ncbi:mRNA surveillance protein pelota, partial [Candidatus Micrarchaeota archaeon]|nr:mRNA surveillance protein pelota [Candidatus Micrarchaeota archaeon]
NVIKLKPEVPEDLWHLEKIIRPGDLVSGSSLRKFTSDSGRSERKHVFITIRCEKAEFHKGFNKLRALGVIIGGHPEEFVSVGSHHSLDFDVGDIVQIEKIRWTQYELDRIKEAASSAKKPKMAALILDERDAEFFTIREYGVDSLGKISMSGRGKYTDESRDAKNKYFGEIYDLIKSTAEKIIIAGPGFEKENFYSFLKDKDAKLVKNVFVESVGNTGRQGVFELINKETVSRVLKESRFAEEVKAVDEIISKLHTDYVTYGLKEVSEAVDYGAVERIVIVDSFVFESKGAQALLEKAERTRASVMMVSHENDVSEKLKALGGVAAVLRFKVS